MSAGLASIESMFDNGVMNARAERVRSERITELQDRIRGMQRTRLDTRALPTSPALADLLPGGELSAGSAYAVADSTTLALGLLQAPSQAGAWCAVIGMPDLGIEAAAGLGLDLDRLVLVPQPGDQWLAVLSALIDVVSVILIRPPATARIGEATAGRLASRLRQREAVLISMGAWPRADARLAVTESDWAGIGSGFGHLAARQVTVSSVSPAWAGRTKSRRLWLPGSDQQIEPVVSSAAGAPHTSTADAPIAISRSG